MSTITDNEKDALLPAIKAPKWLQGFIGFVREQGVVGVAVGLILGISIKSVADSVVTNIINPLIKMLGSGEAVTSNYACLKSVDGICQNKLAYGALFGDIMSFIIMAAVVYFMVKSLKLDKLDKKKD